MSSEVSLRPDSRNRKNRKAYKRKYATKPPIAFAAIGGTFVFRGNSRGLPQRIKPLKAASGQTSSGTYPGWVPDCHPDASRGNGWEGQGGRKGEGLFLARPSRALITFA